MVDDVKRSAVTSRRKKSRRRKSIGIFAPKRESEMKLTGQGPEV